MSKKDDDSNFDFKKFQYDRKVILEIDLAKRYLKNLKESKDNNSFETIDRGILLNFSKLKEKKLNENERLLLDNYIERYEKNKKNIDKDDLFRYFVIYYGDLSDKEMMMIPNSQYLSYDDAVDESFKLMKKTNKEHIFVYDAKSKKLISPIFYNSIRDVVSYFPGNYLIPMDGVKLGTFHIHPSPFKKAKDTFLKRGKKGEDYCGFSSIDYRSLIVDISADVISLGCVTPEGNKKIIEVDASNKEDQKKIKNIYTNYLKNVKNCKNKMLSPNDAANCKIKEIEIMDDKIRKNFGKEKILGKF
jgi:hypothetical protein